MTVLKDRQQHHQSNRRRTDSLAAHGPLIIAQCAREEEEKEKQKKEEELRLELEQEQEEEEEGAHFLSP